MYIISVFFCSARMDTLHSFVQPCGVVLRQWVHSWKLGADMNLQD